MINNKQYNKKEYFLRKSNFFNKRLKQIFPYISKFKIKGKFLDAGCGMGEMLFEFKQKFPNVSFYGTDISTFGLKQAQSNSFNVFKSDLSKKINFRSNYFNIVFSQSVIEHLYNPDLFLEECHRVLKKNGILIIITPNLLAWHQRILCLIGVTPSFMELSTKDPSVGLGIFSKIFKKNHTVGHIRVFNSFGLKKIVENSEFEIIIQKELPAEHNFPKPINYLFNMIDKFMSLFPTLSSVLFIVARKK